MAQLDPERLVKLRETGWCFSQLPEGIFGIGLSGHYYRRIKIEPVIRYAVGVGIQTLKFIWS